MFMLLQEQCLQMPEVPDLTVGRAGNALFLRGYFSFLQQAAPRVVYSGGRGKGWKDGRLNKPDRRDIWGGEMPLQFGSAGKGRFPHGFCQVGGGQSNEDAAGQDRSAAFVFYRRIMLGVR